MKNTAFTHFHEELGAKLSPFCGYIMPIEYSGIKDEHINVREKLGVFDVSHMGEFWVTGNKALDFIQYITTNDASVLTPGKVQYSCFPNGKGGIVDDLLVYCYNKEKYLLVVNAANIKKDWDWCVKNAELMGLEVGKDLRNVSNNIAQLAVQGPLALKAMQKLTNETVTDMEFYTFKTIEFAGLKNVLFATTGYTGAGGCEIYIENKDADILWKAIMDAGEEFGIKPVGLGARDTLRLEMGYCLYGNDIDDTTSPIEAGLGWITKFTDEKNFIDKDSMLKLKEEGVKKRLRGFVLIDRGIPRHHYEITDSVGKRIGEVTSGTMSPMMKAGIGMGYIKTENAKFGSEIFIKVRDKALKAEIVKLPIYKK